MTGPDLTLISLGAGVQSTVMLLLAASGELPRVDGAIFADTGSEPAAVYAHLDRLEKEIAAPAGIPIYRVSYGNLGDDLLDSDRMAMIPAYTMREERVEVVDAWAICPAACGWAAQLFDWTSDLLAGDPVWSKWAAAAEDDQPAPCPICDSHGKIPLRTHLETVQDKGMQGRKCTQTYKLRPLLDQVRLLLGADVIRRPCRYCKATGRRVAPWRAKRGEDTVGTCSVCRGTGEIAQVQQPPAGRWAEQWIGFSTDEVGRVSDRGDTRYSRSRHPLLELGMSREQCVTYLRQHGWDSVAKSACVFCPYRGNKEWRQLRDEAPDDWKSAIDFDEAYRTGAGLNSRRFLHITTVPLAKARIDRIRPSELMQLDVNDAVYAQRLENGDPDGCGPFACRSGEPVTSTT